MIMGVDMEATAKKLTEICKEKGVTKRQIQVRVGFSTPSAIYKWFNGKSIPTVDNLMILADMLEITVDDILVPLVL